MRAWIANTDYEWYRFLSGRPDLDEVNFWRPSGGVFKALKSGEPLLFRLKAPHNAIAGVGFFVHFSVLPASLAWAAFGAKNGAPSEEDMRIRIERYRRSEGKKKSPVPTTRSAASSSLNQRSSIRATGFHSHATGARRLRSAAGRI